MSISISIQSPVVCGENPDFNVDATTTIDFPEDITASDAILYFTAALFKHAGYNLGSEQNVLELLDRLETTYLEFHEETVSVCRTGVVKEEADAPYEVY